MYYLQSRYYDPEAGRFLNADNYISTGDILGYNMFAYCCNNPVMLIDKSGQIPDSYAGGIGENFGELIYEWLTGEEHPSKAAEEQEVEIRQKQNKLIRDGTIVLWDTSMRWYNIQQEAQFMEAQMVATVSPRVIKAGVEMGVEAAIATATACGLKNNNQHNDPKANAASVAVAFVGGFVAGAVMEIWHICEEEFFVNCS